MAKRLTAADLQGLGAAVALSAGMMVALGHDSPRGLVDYVAPDRDDAMAGLVQNLFGAAVIGCNGELAREAVRKFVDDYGLLDVIAELVTQ